MALTKLTKDMAIIQKLDDEPNDVGGLTAAELKAKFDEAGETVKEYLNETLLAELDGDDAAASLGAVLNGERMSVQKALDLLQLASFQSGNVPVGGGTGDVLQKKSGTLYDLEWRPLFTSVAFTEADWTTAADGAGEDTAESETAESETAGDTAESETGTGGYTLTIPGEKHRRRNGDFSCTLRHKVDGVLRTNTWAVLGTQVVYDEATGDVILSAADAYDGTIQFCGGQKADEEIGTALLTGGYTGQAEVSAVVEEQMYDAENMSAQALSAPDGTLIITKVEES